MKSNLHCANERLNSDRFVEYSHQPFLAYKNRPPSSLRPRCNLKSGFQLSCSDQQLSDIKKFLFWVFSRAMPSTNSTCSKSCSSEGTWQGDIGMDYAKRSRVSRTASWPSLMPIPSRQVKKRSCLPSLESFVSTGGGGGFALFRTPTWKPSISSSDWSISAQASMRATTG